MRPEIMTDRELMDIKREIHEIRELSIRLNPTLTSHLAVIKSNIQRLTYLKNILIEARRTQRANKLGLKLIINSHHP
jgi:hypothetical protein